MNNSRSKKNINRNYKNINSTEIILNKIKKGGYRVLIPSKYFGTGGGCPLSYGMTHGFSHMTRKRSNKKKRKLFN